MIEGVKISMGGNTYEVPALSFGQIKRLMPTIGQISTDAKGGMSDTQMVAMGDIVHAALSRNYPDVTRDQVDDMLDLRNAPEVIKAVMGQSGLVSSGEAQAGN